MLIRVLSVLILTTHFIFANPAQAAGNKGGRAAEKMAPSTKPSPLAREERQNSFDDFVQGGHFYIGPSLGVAASSVGFGANFRYLYEFQKGLSVGGQINLRAWPTTVFLLEIPITPMIVYEFETPGTVKPYIGLDLGPEILFVSGSYFGTTASGAAVVFTVSGHFGVNFNKTMGLDLAVGAVSSSFMFSPSFLFRL